MWFVITLLLGLIAGAAAGRWYQSREDTRYERNRVGLTTLKEQLDEAVRTAGKEPATVKRAAAFESAQKALARAWDNPTDTVAVYGARAAVANAQDKAGTATAA